MTSQPAKQPAKKLSEAKLTALAKANAASAASRKKNAVGKMVNLKVPPKLQKKIDRLAKERGVARWKVVDDAL